MIRYFSLVLVGLLLLLPRVASAQSPDDMLIVANLSVKSSTISEGAIRNFFLKKIKNWDSGNKAVPIHAPKGSRLRDDFQLLYHLI